MTQICYNTDNSGGQQSLGGNGGNITKVGFKALTDFGSFTQITLRVNRWNTPTGTLYCVLDQSGTETTSPTTYDISQLDGSFENKVFSFSETTFNTGDFFYIYGSGGTINGSNQVNLEGGNPRTNTNTAMGDFNRGGSGAWLWYDNPTDGQFDASWCYSTDDVTATTFLPPEPAMVRL